MRKHNYLKRKGFALILVLIFSSLLTGTLVLWSIRSQADYSMAYSYSDQVVGYESERMAVDQVIAELQNEAREVSRRKNRGESLSLSPAKWGLNSLSSPTQNSDKLCYLRRSSSFPIPIIPNSSDSFLEGGFFEEQGKEAKGGISDDQENGRSVSAKLWNKPLFFKEPLSQDELPEWIDADNKKENSSISRYAYLAYQVNGLLDLNICGKPEGFNRLGDGPDPHYPEANKSYRYDMYRGRTICADLTQISERASKIGDQAVRWRLPDESSPQKYEKWLYGKESFSSGTPTQGVLYQDQEKLKEGQNIFLGRQDLLNFIHENEGEGVEPYFRHHSSAVNRPELALLTQTSYLAPKKRTFEYYRVDGTLDSYVVEEGDPFFARKFPLARLDWFNSRNADGSLSDSKKEKAILKHFGLKWDSQKNRFVYVSPEGNGLTPATKIKSLTEVMSQGREPDFFEWLKATIVPGSLGVSGGIACSYYVSGTTVTLRNGIDQSTDFHLLQIGCNIIDQWDSDDLPTIVETGFSDLIKPSTALIALNWPSGYQTYSSVNQNLAIGTENLPYLNEIVYNFLRPNNNSSAEAWMQFELWNPHQNPCSVLKGYRGESISSGSVKLLEGQSYLELGAMANLPTGGYLTVNAGMTPNVPTSTIFAGKQVSFSLPSSKSFGEPAVLGSLPGLPTSTAPNAQNEILISSRTTPDPAITLKVGAPNAGKPVDAIGRYCSTGAGAFPSVAYSGGTDLGLKNRNYASLLFQRISPITGLSSDTPFTMELGVYVGTLWVPYQRFELVTNLPLSNYSFCVIAHDSPQTAFTFDTVDSSQYAVNNLNITTLNFYSAWQRGSAKASYMRADPRGSRLGFQYRHFLNTTSGGPIDSRATPGVSIRSQAKWTKDVNNLNSNWDMVYGGPNWGFLVNNIFSGLLNNRNSWSYSSLKSGYRNAPISDVWINRTTSAVRYTELDSSGASILRPGDAAYLNDADFPTIPGNFLTRTPVLNRPFRSIGELGYVFRDLPGKTLDFFTNKSGDLPLLDVFCLEEGEISSGRVDFVQAPLPIRQAILSGAFMNYRSQAPMVLSSTQARELTEQSSKTIVSIERNSDFASQILKLPGMDQEKGGAISQVKQESESVLRSWVESHSNSTWQIMVDIVSQTGKTSKETGRFSTHGERRAWVHASIDRQTGKVLDLEVEHVAD